MIEHDRDETHEQECYAAPEAVRALLVMAVPFVWLVIA